MKFFTLLSLAMTLSFVSLAVSDSKKERGFSCTDFCTADGKDSLLKPEIGDMKLNDFCRGAEDVKGSYASCSKFCFESGGFFSKWAGRQAKVTAYAAQGMEACKCNEACGTGAGQPGWDTKNPQGKMVTAPLEERYQSKCAEDNKDTEGNIHWCKKSCDGIVDTKVLDSKCGEMEKSREKLRQ